MMTRFSSFISCNFIIIIAILCHSVILQESHEQITENLISSEEIFTNETELIDFSNVTTSHSNYSCINSCLNSEFSDNITCSKSCALVTFSENECLDSCLDNDTSCIVSCKTFVCPDKCQCHEVEDVVDIECSKFSARLQPEEILAIHCTNTTESLPNITSIINGSFPYVRFINCPLPSSSFSDVISLHGNKTTVSLRKLKGELTRDHFINLENLKRLDLAFNDLEFLPEDLFLDLTSLTCLELNDNNIKNLSSGIFQNLHNLGELYLDNNRLLLIPEVIFKNLSKLWYLSLWKNDLLHITPPTFNGLIKLQHLDLSNNKLQYFSYSTFSELTALKTIDLSHNSFQFIPAALFIDLDHLSSVKINGNFKSLNSTSDVEWIKGKNKELELPNYLFRDFKKLRKIQIAESGLLNLPRFLIKDTKSIVELDIHGNLLSTLPRFMFQDASNLVSLDISDNILTELPYDLFSELVSLRELRLNGNSMLHQLPRSFTVYEKLEIFQLHDCNFTSLPSVTIRQLKRAPKLRILTLSGNPWQCDCEAKDFVSLAKDKAIDVMSTICEDGRSFSELTDLDLCNVVDIDEY